MSKKRACIIASSLRIMGGQAVQADDILKRFKQDGFAVGFLPVNPQFSGLLSRFQQIKYVRTLLTWPVYVASLLIKVPHYDVLHLFSASYLSFLLAPAPAAIIGKLFGKRIVLNYHSGEAEDHLRRSLTAIQWVFACVDCVVVPSEYLQQVFGKFGIKTTVIPNVVDLEAFPFKERAIFYPRFLVARTLEPLYNVGCVLRAFRVIQDRFPDASLTIVGNGSEELALKELAVVLGLENVRFAGRVERELIPSYYAEHDIMLNASNIDNMPLSILEAFVSGVPVVSTMAGGIPYLVKDRETGMLVHLDDHESLAARAIELLENQHLSRNIVQQAYNECLKKYSWSVIRDQWSEVYGIK
ncbi:MAG: glycosyltransferase family 4 protein [Desulfoprunum sp.]|nr:glycosyltransferase family 4 protein [Desulfoprunum sp.]